MQTRSEWAPPSGLDAELVSAGEWWDALRIPAYLGEPVLDLLGERCGAVIRDPYGSQCLYWLLPCGAARSWTFPDSVEVHLLGPATYVVVPPPHRREGPGLRWERPFVPGRYITDPQRLYAALSEAVDVALDECEGAGR
jgi:hypothetical protein